jgi:hypothetical protein
LVNGMPLSLTAFSRISPLCCIIKVVNRLIF